MINGLDGQTVTVAKGQSALIDPQGDATIVDDDTMISKLKIEILETNIYHLAELEFGANFRVDDTERGTSIYYKGARIGEVDSRSDSSEMTFYPNVSHAVAHELIRTLAYKPHDKNIAKLNSAIKITATDPGGRSSTATIHLDIKNPVHTASGNYIQQGTSLKDRIYGSSDNEIFFPGKGADVVLTGSGKDIIVFDTAPSQGNRDHITDFSVKHDTLWLDNAVFKKLGNKGSELKPSKLDKKFFAIGEAAKDKNDYIFYNNKTGILYYDKDGSGSGKAVAISQFDKKLKMSYNDFYVI
jgi:Ca2+-binding RTX toxin-like protein